MNSLGLTEQQPENNVYRILIEMLAVTLSKKTRARAVQLPAWNEALGLPRPWDQQWSLRMQQILAFETDLLEYGDIFAGSTEIETKVAALKREAREELDSILGMGGAVAAVENSYMKSQLVESNARRVEAIERGEQIVVGVNRFTETEPSPLAAGEGSILTVSPEVEAEQIAKLRGVARRARRQGRGRPRSPICGAPRSRAPTSCRPRSPAPRPASPPANGARCCARALANTAPRPACRTPRATTARASTICAPRSSA